MTSEMAAYRRRPAIERHLMLGRRLVQPLTATTPTELGGSAPLIWDLLAEVSELDGILQELARRFDDAPNVIERGTRQALRQMLDADLIEQVT